MNERELRDQIDLAAERLGGSALYATDEFFAEKENLLKPHKPVWKEHEYTDRGKWMDGWESRRKRTPGHDFVLIRLAFPGVIHGFIVDTSFFRGNFPEACSIDAVSAAPESSVESLLKAEWMEILARSSLKGDSENLFSIPPSFAATHLRFNIYPDGGVARLRVLGEVAADWRRHGGLLNAIDLAAVQHGGQVLECSDMFFGPKHNLIMPDRSLNMSDGWETRRRRGPGHDWVIVKLGVEGTISRVEIDTSHFKGNFPDTASLEGQRGDNTWAEILPRTKMQAHTRHLFLDELQDRGPFTHVRLNVFPDGGVARLRIYGVATERARAEEAARHLNRLAPARLHEELRAVCGSRSWIEGMMKARPFRSWDDLAARAGKIWSGLKKDDWLEAFRAHPRIGERGKGWTAQEQSGVRNGEQFTEANREYEKKFGHIFLVCATGRSGDELMANLRQRLKNAPEEEIRVAANEQNEITKLRLQKLVT